MATETCENCKRIIGELEQAYTWHSHILCKECYARLSNPTAKQPIPVDVHTPIIQPTPQRSLVKSTLIVMATVIAVIVVIYIILSMPSILSQCSRQITIYKANNGDASAQYKLGGMYHFGEGVPKDYTKAVKWYGKAAEQGHIRAQFWLGRMYNFGDGVPKDYTKAVKWYTKAAEQGDVHAQLELGLMYYFGSEVFEGVPQDYKEAVKWYTKAAEQRWGEEAQVIVGDMYAEGKGVTQNYQEAIRWYRKAAEQGDKEGQSKLGYMYYTGNCVVQDYVEAYKWALLAEKDTRLKEMYASKMTPTQIAEAQKLAKEFTEKQEKEKTGKDTKTSGVK